MELKFIGQGLDPESDVTAGNFIIDSLDSENYNSFNAFVAFHWSTTSLGGATGNCTSKERIVDAAGISLLRKNFFCTFHGTTFEVL